MAMGQAAGGPHLPAGPGLAMWGADQRREPAHNRGYNRADSVGTGRSLPALLTPALAGERDAGRGKSELHRAVCRVTPGSGGFKAVRRTVPQKKYRLRKEVRVKRCGKSAPGVQ